MSPEQITVSRELAKELEDSGVKISSCFTYTKSFKNDKNFRLEYTNIMGSFRAIRISAPTAEELLAVMPAGLCIRHKDDSTFGNHMICRGDIAIDVGPDYEKIGERYIVYLGGDYSYTKSSKLADALAEMLIHLIKNKLVNVEELNR